MISPATWRAAEALFHRALELAPEERAMLLDTMRAGDPEVCTLVEEMLAETDLDVIDLLESEPPSNGFTNGFDAGGIPDQVGEYRIVREIGHGGMGVVYEAIQPRLDRHVALKILRSASNGARDSAIRERLLREARRFRDEALVLGLLDHPGVVPIVDLDETAEGVAYFTMRLVTGDDFREVMRKVRVGEDGWNSTRVLQVLQRVCETLAFAHHRGIVHRDIKPSNLMVGSFGEVYVIDWGLARIVSRSQSSVREPTATPEESIDDVLQTVFGDVMGTPSYMSPEQARGQIDRMGPASDVYSLGAVLYEFLAGHPPHWRAGKANDSIAILERVRRGSPPRLLPRRDVIPALAAICDKAMAHRANDRYESIEALGHDLQAYLSQHVVHAYRTGAFAELRMWCVRNRLLAWTVSLALLVVAAAAVRLSWLNQDLHRERDDFFRVATAHDLALVSSELDELWPLDASRVEPLKDWLQRAERLVADLPKHRERLAAIRARALPWTEAERRRDREAHPDFARLLLLEEEIEANPAKVAVVANDLVAEPRSESEIQRNSARQGALDSLARKLEQSTVESQGLRERVATRRTWNFENREDAWWQDQLDRLVTQLEAFSDPVHGAIEGLSPVHGMGARQRLRFAETLERTTRDSAEARMAWDDAIQSIADPSRCPAYAGLAIEPQLGLLPLGIDPRSKLLEFWHPITGVRPERDAEGHWIITEATSVVFVLLPGGRFRCGAQASDPAAPNYDPDADRFGDEGYSDGGGIREIEVAPFLLSKYEMTSAQWLRIAGYDPSVLANFSNGAETVNGRHPVENVDFDRAAEWMRRIDLSLPTEPQWEYACRAGTTTPRWWDGSGADPSQQANLADARLLASGPASSAGGFAEWDDGYEVHAPVGSFPPNPFGIHECLGNVLEWCSNRYTKAGYTVEGREPLHRYTPLTRVSRGGSYGSPLCDVRCSNRFQYEPEAHRYHGLRPSRELKSSNPGGSK